MGFEGGQLGTTTGMPLPVVSLSTAAHEGRRQLAWCSTQHAARCRLPACFGGRAKVIVGGFRN